MERGLLTYTSEGTFQACRRMYYWRYERGIVPNSEASESLFMGRGWHDLCEIREGLILRGIDRAAAVQWCHAWLNVAMANRAVDIKVRRTFLVLSAAINEYERRYHLEAGKTREHEIGFGQLHWIPDSDIEVISVEGEHVIPLINPETNGRSMTFDSAIKYDALVRRKSDGGKLHLLERKLLANLGDVERLWTDFQLARYTHALNVENADNEKIVGAVYDVVVKPYIRLKEGKEESEDDWATRVAEKVSDSLAKLHEKRAAAGKPLTTADQAKDEARVRGLKTMQRVSVPPETDEEFMDRLADHFRKPESMARVAIPFTEETIDEVMETSWESSQQIIDARRRKKWRKNTAHCYHHFGGTCPYLALCRDRMEPFDEAAMGAFREEPPHRELGEKSPLDDVWEMIQAGATPDGMAASGSQSAESLRSFFDDDPELGHLVAHRVNDSQVPNSEVDAKAENLLDLI